MRSHLTQLANDSRPHEKLLPLYEPAMQILGETSNGTSVAAATRIFTQELLQLALDGTPKDMLQKMYKQHCGKTNLLSNDPGRNDTTTDSDSS